MESFEELKDKLIRRFYNQGEMPKKVENSIRTIYEEISNMYKSYGVDARAITSYIEGNFMETKSDLNRINAKRKDMQVDEIRAILFKIQNKIENIEEMSKTNEEDDIKLEKRKQIDLINNTNMHERETTNKVIEVLEDHLMNVRASARRIMSNQQYSDTRIAQIDYEVRERIKSLISKGEVQISEAFKEDDNYIVKMASNMYEQYISGEEKTAHQKFVDEIKVEDNENDLETTSPQGKDSDRLPSNFIDDNPNPKEPNSKRLDDNYIE